MNRVTVGCIAAFLAGALALAAGAVGGARWRAVQLPKDVGQANLRGACFTDAAKG